MPQIGEPTVEAQANVNTQSNVKTLPQVDEEVKVEDMPDEAFWTSPAKELVEISPPRKSPISLKRAKSTNSIPVSEIA